MKEYRTIKVAPPNGREHGRSLSDPLVSVVIPCYNAERTITRAIRSAQKQDYHRLELIIVDDYSTDRTRDVVESIRDERLVFSSASENEGASAARNRGVALASGKYVAFLDADDEWLPSKVSTQVRVMEADINARIATCNCLFLTGRAERRGTFFERRYPAAGPDAWQTLLAYNYIQTSTVLARKEDLEDLHGFSKTLPTGEDQDLWIRLASRGSVCVEPQVLVHVHDEPVSLAKRYQKREAAILLSIVRTHLGELQARLRKDQRCAIWGQRLYDIACNMYQDMEYARSAALFWGAARHGTRRLKSVANVFRALSLAIVRTGQLGMHDLVEGAKMAALPKEV